MKRQRPRQRQRPTTDPEMRYGGASGAEPRAGNRAWRGATVGALALMVAMVVTSAAGLYGPAGPGWVALASLFFVAAFAAVGGVVMLLGLLIRQLWPGYLWAVAAILGVVIFLTMVSLGVAIGVVLTAFVATAAASGLGAGLAALLARRRGDAGKPRRALAIAAVVTGSAILIAGSFWLLDNGRPISLQPYPTSAPDDVLPLPDPAAPGPYTVTSISYGSGTDRHRDAYGQEVAWQTAPVDGSALVTGWNRLRTAYWGFGPEALPRNARVWYPSAVTRENEGPYPLVLIVHGQHTMVDDSEMGYAYLGEHLAGHGYIVVSVDENFLNLSPVHDLLFFSQLQGDGDLRGWLLLEHLRLWRAWATTPGHLFYGKVDMDAVALIGHSRGGEAVAVAAAFNDLAAYPDDATLTFDYGFGIRSVIAFAPVDRMVEPAGQPIRLQDTNYLVLQGAHDMDVLTYMGSSQMARVDLTPGSDTFKAGLYIYGANHGQFNTVWGRKDFFEPVMRIYNLAQLMPGEAQRLVAKVAISAFLEATVRGADGYRAFFLDPRRGAGWLPDVAIRSQYHDAATVSVATFEEDMDPTSATLPGARITGEGLTAWREARLMAKHETRDNQVAVVAWEGLPGETASYAIILPPEGQPASAATSLVFAAANAGERPDRGSRDPDTPASGPIDLTVTLTDRQGRVSRLSLSDVGARIHPQLRGQLGKAAFFSPVPDSEPVLQTIEVPLATFVTEPPDLDVASLHEIRFVFDRTPSGSLVLDDVGFRVP